MSDNRVSKSESTSDVDVVSPSPEKGFGHSSSGSGSVRGGRRRSRLMSGGSDICPDVFSSPDNQLKLKIPAGRVIRCVLGEEELWMRVAVCYLWIFISTLL